MRKSDPFLIAGLLFVSLPLSGCVSLASINIRDGSAFFPTLRASHDLQSPEESRKSLAIDMEVSGASGKSSQYLSSGEYIEHGNDIINGPAQVEASCNLSNAMLGIRSGWIFQKVDIEWMAGLDLLGSEIKLKSGAQSPTVKLFNAGPFFGWKFSLKPTETVRLYVKSKVSTDFSGAYGLTSGELAASKHLAQNVALFAGWRWVNLNYNQDYASDIHIDISGPTVGMEWAF